MNGLERTLAKMAIGGLAGLAGTLAMSAAQLVVERVRGQKSSLGPAHTLEGLLGVRPTSRAAERRLNWLTHFAYGTGWGDFRGLLDVLGLEGWRADLTHFAAVQGTAYVIVSPLTGAEPVWTWGAAAIAEEALYHAIYAGATGAAYRWLRQEHPLESLGWSAIAAGVPALVATTPLGAFARPAVRRGLDTWRVRAERAGSAVRQRNWQRALAQVR